MLSGCQGRLWPCLGQFAHLVIIHVCCCAEDLDEMNIEIMRNTLYKSYLDDFAAFCAKLGGTTGEVMGSMLSFEVRPGLPRTLQ